MKCTNYVRHLLWGLPLLVLLGLSIESVDSKTNYLLNKPECTHKRQKELELEMSRLIPLGKKSRKFPINYDEVLLFCRDIKQIVTQTETFFRNCYNKDIQDYASIMIYTTKQNLRKYCGKQGSRTVRDLLKLAPCANKYVRPAPQPMDCLNEFINKTAQLVNIKPDKVKIPHTCCYYVEGVKCAENFLNSVSCIRSHVPILLDYLRSGTQSMTDLMCGEYNDSTDACDKLGKAPKPEKPNKTKYFMPVSLLVDLMESIDDFKPSTALG